MDIHLEKAQKAAERRKKLEEEEKQMEWGKGLIQKKEKEERIQTLLKEAEKPFARYKAKQNQINQNFA